LSSLAFISFSTLAADPVKPEIGAGSSRDNTPPAVPPVKPSPPGASTGPSSPPDTVRDQEDERKATRSKEKMKKKPGYQEEAPSPRASHTVLMAN
jgi:hypothetical protein